jgi:hypothetical protein
MGDNEISLLFANDDVYVIRDSGQEKADYKCRFAFACFNRGEKRKL